MKKNIFGPEPINTKKQYEKGKIATALLSTLIAVLIMFMIVALDSADKEITELKKEVTEQSIRAHSALNDRDSWADKLKACEASK
ncbi:MAG: hypothetical protein E6R04_09805 [Spirochaetes bacterium]|nr:MAG: hypothetical protein E6R04_09805 [Spirochaetota bacterium]